MTATATACYHVTNWKDYNESLVQRGDITFWFDEDVIDAWEHDNDEPKVGRPFTYSDMAVECLLTLRELFRLPYRQTEGLGRSLAKLMQVDVTIPDYSSLAKRAVKLGISLSVTARRGSIDVVVDSTGLKVFGEGEWKMRKHGKSKRRTWRKLHLTVNPATQEIEAEVLTENSEHDADQVDGLLDQVNGPVAAFYGDAPTTSGKYTIRSPSERFDRSFRRDEMPRSSNTATPAKPLWCATKRSAAFGTSVAKGGKKKLAIIFAVLPKPPCTASSLALETN